MAERLYYNPQTGEFINTLRGADWMGVADSEAPEFDSQTHECFFRDGGWVVSPKVSVESTPEFLNESKQTKKSEIQQKTQLIKEQNGFSYDGKTFPYYFQNGLEWSSLLVLVNNDSLSYPWTIQCLDGTPYQLANKDKALDFITTFIQHETSPDSPSGIERTLLAKISMANSISELNNIMDER